MSNKVAEKAGSDATLVREDPSGEKQSCAEYSGVHFGDVLGSWNNGVQLDLRVKLAVDFLKAGMLARPGEWAAVLAKQVPEKASLTQCLAAVALDIASELLNLGAAEGWVKGLPETGELSGAHRHHLERLTRAQMYPQINGQRLAEDEGAPTIQPARLTGLPRN